MTLIIIGMVLFVIALYVLLWPSASTPVKSGVSPKLRREVKELLTYHGPSCDSCGATERTGTCCAYCRQPRPYAKRHVDAGDMPVK